MVKPHSLQQSLACFLIQVTAKQWILSPIDSAPEEKERGITINTAHVEYETAIVTTLTLTVLVTLTM